MKYISLIIIAFVCSIANVNAQQDAISKYFDDYMEDERFTVVYVSAKLFDMVTKFDITEIEDADEPEVRAAMEVLKDLRGLRVLTTDINPMEVYKEAKSKINTDTYEMLLTVRDKGENVRFWIKDGDNDIINELLLLVGSEDEFVLLSLIGNIDLDKISSLAKTMDVKGMEHLDKVKSNGNK
ncbi:MAG: DUF4252 domain-containing protein [Bacteroidota bacterium]